MTKLWLRELFVFLAIWLVNLNLTFLMLPLVLHVMFRAGTVV